MASVLAGVIVVAAAFWMLFLREGRDDVAGPLPAPTAPVVISPPADGTASPAPDRTVPPLPLPTEAASPTAGAAGSPTDLDQLVLEEVDDFTLGDVRHDNDAADHGATDARFLEYTSSDNSDVVLLGIRLFPSPRVARRWINAVVDGQTDSGVWEVAKSRRLVDDEGNVRGRYILTQQVDASTVQNVRWTNRNVGFSLGRVRGADVDLEAFFDSLPY